MNLVEPIRDKSKIDEILNHLYLNTNRRNYFLFFLCIKTGLNINEILSLKFGNLKYYDTVDKRRIMLIKKQLSITKNKKTKNIEITSEIETALKNYEKSITRYEYLNSDNYIFKSRKSKEINNPIERQQAYRVFNKVAKQVGLAIKIGPHSLRKTFGYHYYMDNGKTKKSLKYLQKLFNHSAPCVTLKYIGLKDENNN